MNYNHLRYFSVLAEMEHYTLAANALGISQPSLSNAMHALEESLGVMLFEKQGRNIRLTRYGRMFKEYVDKALLELENAQRLLHRTHEIEMRLIRVGHVSSAIDLLLPAMRSFSKARPEAYFQLSENTSLLLVEQLREQKLDMVICATKLPDRTMRFQPLVKQRMLAVLPPAHPLADADSITLAALSRYPLIGYNNRSGMHSLIEKLFIAQSLNPRFRCEVGSEAAALRCAADGMGIAIASDTQISHLFPVRTQKIEDAYRTLYLCTLVDKWLSPIAWAFSEHISEQCKG